MGRNLETFILMNYRKAIERHDIRAYYQPVIRTSSRQLCSFEALVRWIDPEIGMIYPGEFIPVMERAGLIHLIDTEILRHACERIRSAVTNDEIPVPISVNLSRLDFVLCDIFSVADRIVSDYKIPHSYICFEITESVMAEEMDMLEGIVERFRSAGYQIWMDDFGSAYSSLNALKELSIDELKLDMRFLRPFNNRSKQIATAVVMMAKAIDIHTLAEGVETEEQFEYLRDIGCEKAQGYFFGKPQPYDEAMSHLRNKGIGIELPQDRQYYDDIGKVDLLSAAPFRTKEEQNAVTTARQISSIPLVMAEFSGEYFKVLFYNTAFEETANESGMFPNVFTDELLLVPQPYYKLTSGVVRLVDSIKAGGSGQMLYADHEQYYEIQARHVSRTKDRYCALIRITNLTKVSQAEKTGYLDEFIRQIYALFDRITLVNNKEGTIKPLYTSLREDLLSGRTGLTGLLKEYAEKYIYPSERERYVETFRPENAKRRFAEGGLESFSEMFRTSISCGSYAWREYTLLKIDEDRYFLLARNVHESVSECVKRSAGESSGGGPYSPSQLWNSLIYSDLLRIFWKDYDRRFLGASKAFLDYYGFASVDEILGKNDEDLGWHVHPDLYKNDEYRVIHEGITVHDKPGHCINEGENREIMASKTPLYDANGEIRGLIGYFLDTTLLMANNNKRNGDSTRKDLLTGLLNSRGISEEAASFMDEYYLRGTDFVRMHIAINDFSAINHRYGFDFGDKVLNTLGRALKRKFGRTCTVGRYSGNKFILIRQVESMKEPHVLRASIKEVGKSVQKVEGIPLTLYLSVGYTLFSECMELDEQTRICEIRLDADQNNSVVARGGSSNMTEIFRMFDDLPVSFSVYHVVHTDENVDAIIMYANKIFQQEGKLPIDSVLGHSVRELFPFAEESWFGEIEKAAYNGEKKDGILTNPMSGKKIRYVASQIICPGYCSVTYLEL